MKTLIQMRINSAAAYALHSRQSKGISIIRTVSGNGNKVKTNNIKSPFILTKM